VSCFVYDYSLHLGLCRFSCFGERGKEKTLAIIKPDGVYGNCSDKIKSLIIDGGFSITKEMKIQLDEVSAGSFYTEHSSKSFFRSLVEYMTSSGPVVVMILEKDNAVADWRELIGPTDAEKAKVTHPQSIRAMCGINAERNCVHGSDAIQSALREISFFFGMLNSLLYLIRSIVFSYMYEVQAYAYKVIIIA
ncbi:putative nucleoside diphosphate kinase 5, partial [Bienertia sinuspersici]